MKNNKLPSAEMVGRNSARSELILNPKFSILIMVEAVIMFSFCAIKVAEVSLVNWPVADSMQTNRMKTQMAFFIGFGFLQFLRKIAIN